MMAFRAIILLAFLVTVPLFAIFGKNAPDVVKALIQNYAPGSNPGVAALPEDDDAPIFRPALVSPSSLGTQQANLSDNLDKPRAMPSLSRPAQGGPGQSNPLSPDAGLLAGSPAGVRTAVGQFEAQPAIATIAHAEQERASGAPRGAVAAANQSATLPANRFPRDYFQVAEQRLRDLGARYYLLETFGPQGESYRFFCKVAAGQNSDQVRDFVAMDYDPLVAMHNVVQQVERWRAVRHQ